MDVDEDNIIKHVGPSLIEQIQEIIEQIQAIDKLTDEELKTIAHHINNRGVKGLVYLFLARYPDAIPTNDLHINATRRWWMEVWNLPSMSKMPNLNFKMDAQGFVVADLWHTRRGNDGPASFKNFDSKSPTFFFGSRGLVDDNYESLQDYVDEAEEFEDSNMYVKRGRFRFKPLLWFDDTDVVALRDNREKAEVIQQLVNAHPMFVAREPSFDLREKNDATWNKMLYHKREKVGQNKRVGMPLRLDNNCVERAEVPINAGFQGTLSVDVSGFGGASLEPGSVPPDTKSVVLWDVPSTVVDEGEWERLYF
tara:strand:- start:968 stop:1894 length:927 start_codon:yes stop_codon:yes gene_type:complete